jgi:hypothetical protein
MKICQVFVHAIPDGKHSSTGSLTGRRRPHLGPPRSDPVLNKLS